VGGRGASPNWRSRRTRAYAHVIRYVWISPRGRCSVFEGLRIIYRPFRRRVLFSFDRFTSGDGPDRTRPDPIRSHRPIALCRPLLRRNIAPARTSISLRVRHFFFVPRRILTTTPPTNSGERRAGEEGGGGWWRRWWRALKNEPGHYFCSPPPPSPTLLAQTDRSSRARSLPPPSHPFLPPPSPLLYSLTSFPPAQLAMCRISECAKMKREKKNSRATVGDGIRRSERNGRWQGRRRRGGRKGGGRKNYISFSHVSLVCPFGRFGSDMDMRPMADISGERVRESHFQFNLLKARQKVIRYFTGAVDRGDGIARASS